MFLITLIMDMMGLNLTCISVIRLFLFTMIVRKKLFHLQIMLTL